MLDAENEAGNKIQKELASKLMGLFDFVVSSRANHYRENPRDRPSRGEVSRLISNCGNMNAAISMGAGLIPGPWGMAAAVPEIAAVIRNQLVLIYDIGVAYGKSERILKKELLAGVFASALGSTGIGLLTMHGGKILVKRVSLRVFQRVVVMLAGRVSQQLLKRMIAKWLPVAGAVAMAAWSKYTTNMVGRKAREVFELDIQLEGSETCEDDGEAEFAEGAPSEVARPSAVASLEIQVQKILTLMNMMKADGHIAEQELQFLKDTIAQYDFSPEQMESLRARLTTLTKDPVDYAAIRAYPDEALNLMVDLVALSKRDGHVHPAERMYARMVGETLGFQSQDITDLLEAD